MPIVSNVENFSVVGGNASPAISRSTISQILLQLEYLIVASGFYSDRQVFVTLDPDPWPTLAGPWVGIYPGSHTLIDGQWEGGGSYLAGYEGEVQIRLADQAMRDELGRDDSALLDANTGLLDRGFALIEYLSGESAARNLISLGLVQDPLIPSSIAEPTYRLGGKTQGDRRWRGIDLGFTLTWTHLYQRGMVTVPTLVTPVSGSSITNLMVGLKSLIVAGGFYQDSQVFVTMDPDPWPTLSGPFCAIRVGSQNLINEQWAGAGANLAGYSGQILIRVADQALRDEIGRDDSALLTTDIGLLDLGVSMIEYLTGQSVSNTLIGSGLVQKDLVPRRIAQPTYRRGGASKSDRRWRGIDLSFDVQWSHVYRSGMS